MHHRGRVQERCSTRTDTPWRRWHTHRWPPAASTAPRTPTAAAGRAGPPTVDQWKWLEVSRGAEVARRIDRPAAAGPVVAAARPIRPLERSLPLLHASRCDGALTVMCFSRSHLKPSGVWSSLSITLDAIGAVCFVGDTSTDRWVARYKRRRGGNTHESPCRSGQPYWRLVSRAALIRDCTLLSTRQQPHRALPSAEPLPLSAQRGFTRVGRCFKV